MFLKERWNTFAGKSFIAIVILFLVRMIAMLAIPLNDSTEARYAEIARLMLENNNWVSLMHYPNQYFWAKPPLSTWLSAISMKVMGVSPFAARFPAIILSIICLTLVARMAYQQLRMSGAIWVMAILSTTFYFLLDAGTVMTDPSLLTCVTLVMVGFWLGLQENSRFWAYMTFVGWGLGLLAKGPVMGIFTVMPLVAWLSMTGQWRLCWQRLPWIKGSLLTLTIALPWYLVAEQRMPGFLNYFIIGEHFMRFLKPGWTGDLYGFAHQAPIGMIWLYFILGSMPWSLILAFWIFSKNNIWRTSKDEKNWLLYLLSFVLLPLCIFTFARNIIYPYVFPTLPAFALLFTTVLFRVGKQYEMQRVYYVVSGVLAALLLVVTWLFNAHPMEVSKSTDQMIAIWEKQRTSSQEPLIYVHNLPEYSSMFYSRGRVKATRDPAQLCQWLQQGPHFVVLDSAEPCYFQDNIKKEYPALASIKHRERVDTLYRIDKLPAFCEDVRAIS